ncbi:MAG: gamma-glutamyltransferase [Verrucomicrobiota bacterium]
MSIRLRFLVSASFLAVTLVALSAGATAVPVAVTPVTASQGMVVAGHPEASAAGVAVLKAGGNAIDAAVAVSLSLGVAEPHGSGMGGKLIMVYYDAASRRTFAVDGLDAAPHSLDVERVRRLSRDERRVGWTSVLVPGLPAGLWLAHQKWGSRPWAEAIAPAIKLAREGFLVLPKTRDQFAEQEKKLRSGDREIAKWYLPGGKLPEAGTRLANADLARTMELYAAQGADAFYKGPVAAAIAAAAKKHGGFIQLDDLARYQARISEPLAVEVFGHRIEGGPAPTAGVALYATILKALETETWAPGPLRTPENLHKVGKVWQQVQPLVSARIADVPGAEAAAKQLLSADSIAEIRRKAGVVPRSAAWNPALADALAFAALEIDYDEEPLAGSTTHFVIVDAKGNVVSCTQSTSLHFGAGVIAPGTGVVLNDTLSNFGVTNTKAVNMIAPGKRARSTTSPSIVFRDGQPVLAIGVPGAQRIPIALLQVLLDHLAFKRPVADAIGDTRLHLLSPETSEGPHNVWEVEKSFPDADTKALTALGWQVKKVEAAGTGRHFGGVNAIAIGPKGVLTGIPDPRRTNAAVGY